MRPFWLHLRNCPVRWAVPPLIALDLAVLFLRNRYWLGVWPQAGAAAQLAAYLVGPVVAGLAAWTAAAPLRYRMTEQTAAARVPHVVLEAHRLVAAVVLLALPYLVGQAVAFALTARTFPPGVGLWAGYFGYGLFVTLLDFALGWLLGRLFGSVFAALAAALSGVLLITVLSRLAPFGITDGSVEMEVDLTAGLVRLGLIVAVLIAALWISTSGTARFRTAIPALLCLGAVVLTALVTPVRVHRPPAGDDVLCVKGRTTLCIWPEDQKYLPTLRAIGGRVDALPPAFRLPDRMNEYGIEQNWHRADGPHGPTLVEDSLGPPTFYILAGSIWSLAGDLATGIMETTFHFTDLESCTWKARTDTDRTRLNVLGAWLESYLAGGGRRDYHTNAPPEMQAAWAVGREMAAKPSLDEQFGWADGEVRDLSGRYCRTQG
ncbi:hypothetical protein [Plantactinospora sp. KBS50]|uniref:hypothetical protein n=1 Tax=Plantactinospora sp. KBS50 TaxID=2024580 RepID=UPI000BAAC9A1|nr:hypothetical protein [Plantactinospora sp. KBS50]ASW53169.1 hypothetical protein CIK06_01715 [Plantactinospora sp. KBS50]